ncbi:hypothetical protein MMC25_006573 [Agyrium rufum]|nr:hypothetical protein [Agyrium rufum]
MALILRWKNGVIRTLASTKSSGPYNRNFEQYLIDGRVFPNCYLFPNSQATLKPGNWDEINQLAMKRQASLSSSKFTDAAHSKFVMADAHAKKEDQFSKHVIPFIEGNIQDAACVSGNLQFRNLRPLIDGYFVSGNPNLYYGARPEQLNRRIREDLNNQSDHTHDPG